MPMRKQNRKVMWKSFPSQWLLSGTIKIKICQVCVRVCETWVAPYWAYVWIWPDERLQSQFVRDVLTNLGNLHTYTHTPELKKPPGWEVKHIHKPKVQLPLFFFQRTDTTRLKYYSKYNKRQVQKLSTESQLQVLIIYISFLNLKY